MFQMGYLDHTWTLLSCFFNVSCTFLYLVHKIKMEDKRYGKHFFNRNLVTYWYVTKLQLKKIPY